MQPMRPHQGKEGRQKAAALPTIAFLRQVRKLSQLHSQKGNTKHKCYAKPGNYLGSVLVPSRQHAQATSKAAGKQNQRLNQHKWQTKQMDARRPAKRVIKQQRIG